MILNATQWAAIVCVIGMSLGQVLFKVSANSLNASGSIFRAQDIHYPGRHFGVYAMVSVGWVWVLRKAHLGRFSFLLLAYILVPLASYYFLMSVLVTVTSLASHL